MPVNLKPSTRSPPVMSPNSRPPLTSRIRASFEGKRSADAKSPTHNSNGFFAQQDPETLRNAIDQAINSDAFQAAIAKHLARLIEPGIKSALDTIQPVVEAVYSHEMLLRKTNQSVENLLTRIDTGGDDGQHGRLSIVHPQDADIEEEEREHGPLSSHPPNVAKMQEMEKSLEVQPPPPPPPRTPAPAPPEVSGSAAAPDIEHIRHIMEQNTTKTAAEISALSKAVDANNSRIAEVVEKVDEMNASLAPTVQTLPSLRTFSENSTTTASVMQAQLDQLQTDMGTILQAVPAELGTHIKEINERTAGQDTSILATHTSKLDALSEDIAALKSSGGGGKDDSEMVEILQAISSNLGSLKEHVETSTVSSNENFNTLGSQITNVISAIEAQNGTLGDIKDSHASHTAVLCEIKDRGLGSGTEFAAAVPAASSGFDPSGLETTTAEILAAVNKSNDSHAAHATALDNHGTALEGLKSTLSESTPAPAPASDNTETTAALQALSADLASLKENIEAGLTSNGDSFNNLATKIDDVLTALEAQKEANSSSEILAGVQQSNEAHIAHAAALEGLKSLGSASSGEVAPAVDISGLDAKLDEVLAAHAAHSSALEGLKSLGSGEAATAPAVDISGLDAKLDILTASVQQANDSHTSHASALEELKTLDRGASGGEPVPAVDISGLDAKLDDVLAAHASHASALDGLKSLGGGEAASAPAVDISGLEAKLDTVLATIEAHKAADQSTEILAGVQQSNEAHSSHATALASHATALEGLKSLGTSSTNDAPPAAPVVDISGLESKLDDVRSLLEAHKTEIMAGIQQSNESHAAHATSLEGLRSIGAPSGDESAPNVDLSGFEAKLDDVRAILEAHSGAHTSHSTALEGLKSLNAPSGETAPAVDITGLDAKLDDVLTTLEAHRAADQTAEILAGVQQSNEAHNAHAAALEGLKSLNLSQGSEASPNTGASIAGLESAMGNIISVLDSHTTALEEIKAKSVDAPSENTAVVTQEGGAIEAHTSSIVTVLDLHKTALDQIITTLDTHTSLLTELKDDVGAEILTGMQACNESHASHSMTLKEIRESDVSDEILTALHTSNDSHANHTTAIAALQAAVAESHAAHSGSLEEIKSRSIEPAPVTGESGDLSGLQTQISAIATTLEGHDAHLAAIKDATAASNDFHATNMMALAEIKGNQTASAPAAAVDLSGLEAQITTIIAALEIQTATLAEIKEATSSPEVLAAIGKSQELLTTQHDLLTSHTSLLDTIKEGNSHAEILENISSLKTMVEESRAGVDAHGGLVKDLHEETKNSNSQLSTAIAALAVGGAAGAGAEAVVSSGDDNKELLEEIKSIVSKSSDTLHTDIIENIASLKSIVEESRAGIDTHSGLVKDLHEETKNNNSQLTTAIEALAVGGVAGAGAGALASSSDDDKELLTSIQIIVTSSSEKLDSIFSQLDINQTTLTTSITSLSDELKAEIDASSTDLHTSITTLSDEVHSAATDVKGLEGKVQSLDGHVEITASQVGELLDGVHLNDKGVFQLAEHAVTTRHVGVGGIGVAGAGLAGLGGIAAGAAGMHALENDSDNVSGEIPIEEAKGLDPLTEEPESSEESKVIEPEAAVIADEPDDESPGEVTALDTQVIDDGNVQDSLSEQGNEIDPELQDPDTDLEEADPVVEESVPMVEEAAPIIEEDADPIVEEEISEQPIVNEAPEELVVESKEIELDEPASDSNLVEPGSDVVAEDLESPQEIKGIEQDAAIEPTSEIISDEPIPENDSATQENEPVLENTIEESPIESRQAEEILAEQSHPDVESEILSGGNETEQLQTTTDEANVVDELDPQSQTEMPEQIISEQESGAAASEPEIVEDMSANDAHLDDLAIEPGHPEEAIVEGPTNDIQEPVEADLNDQSIQDPIHEETLISEPEAQTEPEPIASIDEDPEDAEARAEIARINAEIMAEIEAADQAAAAKDSGHEESARKVEENISEHGGNQVEHETISEISPSEEIVEENRPATPIDPVVDLPGENASEEHLSETPVKHEAIPEIDPSEEIAEENRPETPMQSPIEHEAAPASNPFADDVAETIDTPYGQTPVHESAVDEYFDHGDQASGQIPAHEDYSHYEAESDAPIHQDDLQHFSEHEAQVHDDDEQHTPQPAAGQEQHEYFSPEDHSLNEPEISPHGDDHEHELPSRDDLSRHYSESSHVAHDGYEQHARQSVFEESYHPEQYDARDMPTNLDFSQHYTEPQISTHDDGAQHEIPQSSFEEATHPDIEQEQESEPTYFTEPTHSLDRDLASEHQLSPPSSIPATPLEGEASPTAPADAQEEPDSEAPSASTSAFASPTSPSFPSSGNTSPTKKGKKGKEKKGKKAKKEAFVFNPDEDDEGGAD